MIRGDGAVKLLDFGIARQIEEVATPGAAASGPESTRLGLSRAKVRRYIDKAGLDPNALRKKP